MKLLDIAEVVEASGVPASTLRYYEEQGLVLSAARHGLRRQYLPGVVLQLGLINMGKAAGFSLAEIGAMFGGDGRPELPRDDLHRRADALQAQVRQLEALADALRHVADCPAPSHLECPKFQRLMRVSTEAARRRTKRNGGPKAPASSRT
ncbi:helix-turn-helix domain-containing protein [Paracoccus zhejiangensis]|uniref:MerR family transcriptional regulator n=1 Tax=Paracoccus zhejiangensis TaxID=1077935 RepID=A0A2H5EYM1_9RHOB|nr:helix-turn-helix domain-containing protein [Paracoccus zhejiangensis]AUH64406.1 MerR family transcriptional regulator [Paracoccus zhejiangensis]